MTEPARREYTEVMRGRYAVADRLMKSRILDEYCRTTLAVRRSPGWRQHALALIKADRLGRHSGPARQFADFQSAVHVRQSKPFPKGEGQVGRTVIERKLIAALAMVGLSSGPKTG